MRLVVFGAPHRRGGAPPRRTRGACAGRRPGHHSYLSYESLHAHEEARRWYLWVGAEGGEPANRRRGRRQEDEEVVHEASALHFQTFVNYEHRPLAQRATMNTIVELLTEAARGLRAE